MSDQIIRQDIIEIGFDTDLKELTEFTKEIDKLKKELNGNIGDDAFDDFKDEAKDATKETDSFTKKVKNLANSGLPRLKSGLKQISTQLTTLARKAGTAAFNGLKKVASISFKALAVGIAGAAAATAALVKNAVSAYADYEQLVGGVDTLFKNNSATVQKFANDAYKTAGLSANAYMETVTSFSAAMINSVGGDTAKAAELSNMAITDMSDNANKMGSDMDSIIQTYQSLSRGNFAMLDNLKLGYGGTKEELKRLIKDASKLDKTVKANDTSFANIAKAIHAVQTEMNITGTTSREASETISGSLSAMKATWQNLMPALIQGGDSFDQCVKNLVSSVKTFAKNIKPAIISALSGVGDLITELAPVIEQEFPTIVDELLPPLITAATSLLTGLIKALPSIVKTVAKEIPNIVQQVGVAIAETFGEQFSIIRKIGDFFTQNSQKIAKGIKIIIPTVIALAAAFKGFKAVKSITSLFGGKSAGGGGEKGGGFGGITNIFKNLANTKPTVILKGMANIAIIFGGLITLTAVLMKLAPYMAQLTDVKSFAKLVISIGVIGLVGMALAKFAGIAGKVPVVTVVKGLANMAIMLAGMSVLYLLVGAISLINFDLKRVTQIVAIIGLIGTIGAALAIFGGIVGLIPVYVVALGLANMAIMLAGLSALYLLIGAVSKINFDLNKIVKIIGIITLLGAVGAALSIFAGIAGVIPIPVVLAGLANMALVLGGITALILAFGKLSEIKGFNEFITKGGETLANLFGVIGNIAGSLIGGLGEGLSKSLPAIGENISKFATSLQPMFTMFNGADMAGIGEFFKGVGSFMLQMAGEGILSFFTGGTDFAGLGTSLNEFAENSKGFFTTVANLPEDGFTNAKALFDSLAGMKSLPKDGGVAGWFTGSIDYGKLADGLGKLASENVTTFFNTVAGIKQEGFDNATTLFDCLANMKSLPKEGGVAGWFTGKINYEKIAEGLGHLGGEKVKNFFEMAGSLNATAFENVKLLFDSLSDMKLPKEDNWWDKSLGSETKTLSSIAADLGDFGAKTKSFFEQVNNLKVSNLNGLWKSLKSAGELTATNLSEVFDESVSTLVTLIAELPQRMGDALKNNSKGLSDGLVSMWKDAVEASATPVNKLLSGANHILKEFGSKKKVISWEPYASGTSGHRGGNALVNDGRGAELIQMPNGRTFIPRGRNVFLPNAPKGMKVLPAESTARLLGRKSPTFNYADGIGDIDIWSFFDNAKGLVEKITETITYGGGLASDMGKAMVSTFSGEMSTWVEKLFKEEGGKSLSSYVASKGVMQWRSTVARALKMEGQYSIANVARTLFQMQTESGGNPYAINRWDSNAKKGTPSKGLMQVIDPTFNAYARAGFNTNIYDPLSNILASIRYATSRYGSLSKAYRGVGYSSGIGEVTLPEKSRDVSVSYTPESHYTGGRAQVTEYNTYSPTFNFTISGTTDDRATARKVKQWVVEAWREVLEDIDSTTPQTQQV